VHPASPILLTKNGPLGDQILVKTSVKKVLLRVHLEFENKLKFRKLQDF
jgi:Fe2+ transport system protein FeoA